MFSHVIVPVDTADVTTAHQSLATAKLNLMPEGTITLLHVLEPLPAYIADQLDANLMTTRHNDSMKVLESLRDKEGLGAKAKCVVETGRPYRKILELVANPVTDAIVMSGHSPKLSDVLLGSVASQVVRHAQCSVFVLRHQSD
ncbi:MAG: universal stress protein [Burkholderiaceae bacterium]